MPKPYSKSKSKSSGDEEEDRFQLSKNRFLTVAPFKGKVRIDVREFYLNDEGQRRPGKKGISLSKEEWEKLKDQIPEIDEKIKKTSGSDSESD